MGTEKPGLEWVLVIKGGEEREVRRLGEGVGCVEGISGSAGPAWKGTREGAWGSWE